MVISKEQSETIKKRLIEQIDKSNQPDKEKIVDYIKTLDESGLEQFLKQNKIEISDFDSEKSTPLEQECIFCSIINGKIPSYKIAETKKAVAILEINPLSKGHSLVIPTEHLPVEKMPKSALSLAQKLAKKIKKKLKSEDIKIETSNLMGHGMINIVPLYKDVPTKKIKAEEKDLEKLQSKLESKTRAPRKKVKEVEKNPEEIKQELSKLPKISFRIP
ncbi:MAG: HIT domain-containing protein [Candidatus Pacearchaeota archaeon]|jgi:diadenosine tetraphosphate (Ap4A) HIT family hydrolase